MTQVRSDLKGKGMKINPLTKYYKSVFYVLLRGILINNPSVSTQFPYRLEAKSSFFFVSFGLYCSL